MSILLNKKFVAFFIPALDIADKNFDFKVSFCWCIDI
jgi:hypothetical protein